MLALLLSVALSACSGEGTTDAASDAASTPTETGEVAGALNGDLWKVYDRQKSERLTAAARILAGLSPESDAIAIDSSAWDAYTQRIESAWAQLESNQLEPLQTWREENLTAVPADAPVLYPFSGPDFLYVSSFFPDAPVYVMVGLEPIGTLPDFENASEEELTSIFDWADKSMFALLNFSFFRTNSMEKDLQDRGTLPIMLLFAARNGYDILDLNYVGIDETGKVQPLKSGNPDELVPGIRIDVKQTNSSRPQQLYYFSVDLSDAGFDSRPGLEKFFGQLDRPVAYLKAASYLMHNEYFSIVRDALLERSQFLLQDDSGIPLRFFDADNWNRSFFGQYTGPIELFAARLQADLKAAFTAGENVSALPFSIGYKYQGDSNLMLAERQDEPPRRGELESPQGLMPAPEPATPDEDASARGDREESTSGKAAPTRRDRDDAPEGEATTTTAPESKEASEDEPTSLRGEDRHSEEDKDGENATEGDEERDVAKDEEESDGEARIPKPNVLRDPEELAEETEAPEDDAASNDDESEDVSESETEAEIEADDDRARESEQDEDGVYRIPAP